LQTYITVKVERLTHFSYKQQDLVVNQIEKSHFEIDNGINLLLTQIEKLKDYKTTQINSAIKGKIKITPEMVEQ